MEAMEVSFDAEFRRRFQRELSEPASVLKIAGISMLTYFVTSVGLNLLGLG